MTALNELATSAYDDTRTFDEVVHFVHVYVIEPHPVGEPSPYSGEEWTMTYSDRGQAYTYDERVDDARDMLPLIQGNQLVLVDELTPRPLNNPAWCTYGTCPNCGYLIGQDGVIQAEQTWATVNGLETAIRTIVGD